mgnify:CR=1 FL=1
MNTISSEDTLTPINLGNPREINMLELALVITDLTNSGSEIVFKELPQDDPLQRKPDISKAIRELGWEPKVLLNEGLEKTIEYFGNN